MNIPNILVIVKNISYFYYLLPTFLPGSRNIYSIYHMDRTIDQGDRPSA